MKGLETASVITFLVGLLLTALGVYVYIRTGNLLLPLLGLLLLFLSPFLLGSSYTAG
jgi:hypothetical protein